MKINVQFNAALMLLLFVFLTTGFVACGSGKDKKDSLTGSQTETGGHTGTNDDTDTGDKTGTGSGTGTDDGIGPGDNPGIDDGTGTDKTVTISGSVSGTTILAVNDSDDIVASDDTAGKTPDVNGNYPFTLTGIHIGQNIRIYLIHFGIYPVYFDTNLDSVSDTNVFYLTSSVTIDLGFVDTDIEAGKAIPSNIPIAASGIKFGLEDTSIPSVVNKPIITGLSLSELLANGFSTLNNGWVLRSRDFFKAAVDLAENVTNNDADTARVFYALTRISAIGFDSYSDKNSSDMNKVGDILDRLGCDDSDLARANAEAISCTNFTPENSPVAGELQIFLYNVVRPELEGAISNLDDVSTKFNKQLTELTSFFEGTVDLDYGDVLIVRAAIKSALAFLLIEHAYDLDFDAGAYLVFIDSDILTTEQFLSGNPGFLLLNMSRPYLELLSNASDHIAGSLDDLVLGIDSIQAELDNQGDDLITLEGMTPGEITEAKNIIAVAKTCLSGPCTLSDNDTSSYLSDDAIIDLTYFFGSKGVQDLKDIIPPFSGNDVSGFFPDTDFGGVFVQGEFVNEDINGDNIPDILQ